MAVGDVLPDERHHLALRLTVTALVLATAGSAAGLLIGVVIDQIVGFVAALVVSSP